MKFRQNNADLIQFLNKECQGCAWNSNFIADFESLLLRLLLLVITSSAGRKVGQKWLLLRSNHVNIDWNMLIICLVFEVEDNHDDHCINRNNRYFDKQHQLSQSNPGNVKSS